MTTASHFSLLVVDDEPDLRTLYELTLLREGYDLDTAGTVQEALLHLRDRTYSAVITDMRLPDGTGLDILRWLEEGGRREKAIVITAYGSSENAVEALKSGAYDYLTKPVDLKQFRGVIDVNLSGAYWMAQAAARVMVADGHGGSIVNTASVLSYLGGGRVPGYSASKGGVAQLTKSLAIAYADEGIRVNAIAPGWVATSLTQTLQQDPERSDAIVRRTPLRRWGQPDDIAGAAVFLCSPAARFVTGAVLPVDGGYLAY